MFKKNYRTYWHENFTKTVEATPVQAVSGIFNHQCSLEKCHISNLYHNTCVEKIMGLLATKKVWKFYTNPFSLLCKEKRQQKRRKKTIPLYDFKVPKVMMKGIS